MLDASPEARSARTGEVTAIFLQDAQGLDQSGQGNLDLKNKEPLIKDHNITPT